VRLSFLDGSEAAKATQEMLNSLPAVARTVRDGDSLTIWSSQPEDALYHLFGFTRERSYRVDQVSIRELSLEDVFIAYTGKEWRD
jgi:ABC-2 type transport system ATP-binding protein